MTLKKKAFYNVSMDKYQALSKILEETPSLVVFTGAGMSVPSGIPDFRSAKGIYSSKGYRYPPQMIISHGFFESNTEKFYKFYKEKMIYLDAKPNAAHLFFANYEKKHPQKQVMVVTQNIDGLHQEAGSRIVYELHGSIHRNYCQNCGAFYDARYIYHSDGIPTCEKCGGVVKPDVVLYDEQLDEPTIEKAISAISTVDTMIVIGTSLVVYPAASFVRFFRGKHLIVINKEPTSCDQDCELVFNEDVINVINKLNVR